MTTFVKSASRATVAILAGAAALFANDLAVPTQPATWITQAQAIIGRPLTPLSYAGVARRTTRRAVVAGAAVGAAVAAPVYPAPVYAAPVYPAPACYQHVDVYGRVYTSCP